MILIAEQIALTHCKIAQKSKNGNPMTIIVCPYATHNFVLEENMFSLKWQNLHSFTPFFIANIQMYLFVEKRCFFRFGPWKGEGKFVCSSDFIVQNEIDSYPLLHIYSVCVQARPLFIIYVLSCSWRILKMFWSRGPSTR